MKRIQVDVYDDPDLSGWCSRQSKAFYGDTVVDISFFSIRAMIKSQWSEGVYPNLLSCGNLWLCCIFWFRPRLKLIINERKIKSTTVLSPTSFILSSVWWGAHLDVHSIKKLSTYSLREPFWHLYWLHLLLVKNGLDNTSYSVNFRISSIKHSLHEITYTFFI